MNTPRRLPTTRYKGQEYFIDERLNEFRPVDRPFDPVPFNSDKGRKITESHRQDTRIYTVTCAHCGKFLYEGTKMDIKRMIIYCTECTVKKQDPSGD